MTYNGIKLNLISSLISRQPTKPFEQIYFTNPNFISLFSIGLDKNLGIFNFNLNLFTKDLMADNKFRDLILHWESGIHVSETNLINLMLIRINENGGEYKGLKTESDIREYYRQLDKIFDSVKLKGLQLPMTNKLISKSGFKMDGIVVNIDFDGKLVFAGRGTHRLAMAKSASLPVVPIFIRKIHIDSLRNKLWQKNLISMKLSKKKYE
jgi:hypothetical protein